MKKIFFIFFFSYLMLTAQRACIEKYRNDTLIEKTNFNQNGKITEKLERIITPSVYHVVKTKYGYTSDGLLASIKVIQDEIEQMSISYMYDDQKRPVRTKYYSKGKFQGKEVAIYEGDVLVKEIRFGPTYTEWEKEYSYDTNGLLIKKTIFFYQDSTHVKNQQHYYKYKNGRLFKDSSLVDDSTQSVTEYDYDTKGRLIRKEIKFDTGNNVVFEYRYKGKENFPFYELEKHGNYIMRENHKKYNKKGEKIKEITIEYRNYKGNMKPIKTTYTFKYYDF